MLAHAPSEEEAQSGIVDLDDPANVLMKGIVAGVCGGV